MNNNPWKGILKVTLFTVSLLIIIILVLELLITISIGSAEGGGFSSKEVQRILLYLILPVMVFVSSISIKR